ncbi:MAG: hypothetical protein CMH98_13955 [Oceanospirillaceae bacterium]|nr:hypothetical protein [Oceanospirillaceae bacterium]
MSMKLDFAPFTEEHTTKLWNTHNKHILSPGVYAGFDVVLSGGLNVTVGANNDENTAAVDYYQYCLAVRMDAKETLLLTAGEINHVVIDAEYHMINRTDNNQVVPHPDPALAEKNMPWGVGHAQLKVVTDATKTQYQLVLATFDVPAGAVALTEEMRSQNNTQAQPVARTSSTESVLPADVNFIVVQKVPDGPLERVTLSALKTVLELPSSFDGFLIKSETESIDSESANYIVVQSTPTGNAERVAPSTLKTVLGLPSDINVFLRHKSGILTDYREKTSTTLTDSVLDFADGNVAIRTLTGPIAFSLANIPTAGSAKLELLLTAGGHAVDFTSIANLVWELSGQAPTLNTTDRIVFSKYDGDTNIYAAHSRVV